MTSLVQSLFISRPRLRLNVAKILRVLRTRKDLARLDDVALRDVGLTRGDVRAELRRPVWDVQDHWLK